MDDGVGFLLAVFFCVAGAMVTGVTAYDAGKNSALKEVCEAQGKTWARFDGKNQCVTVTP